MDAAATGYFCFATGLVCYSNLFLPHHCLQSNKSSAYSPEKKKKVISPFNFWFFFQPEGMKQSGSGHVCSTVLP